VISRHGPGPSLKLSPRRVVAILKFSGGPFFVREVPSSKNGSGNALKELCGGARPFDVLATCDIAGTNERKGLSVW
jgi:hypothetical protein